MAPLSPQLFFLTLLFMIAQANASLIGELSAQGPTIQRGQRDIPDYGTNMQLGWEFRYGHSIRPQAKLFVSAGNTDAELLGFLVGMRAPFSAHLAGTITLGPGIVGVIQTYRYIAPIDTTSLIHPVSNEFDNPYQTRNAHHREPAVLSTISLDYTIKRWKRFDLFLDGGIMIFSLLHSNPNIAISPYVPYVTPFVGIKLRFTMGKLSKDST